MLNKKYPASEQFFRVQEKSLSVLGMVKCIMGPFLHSDTRKELLNLLVLFSRHCLVEALFTVITIRSIFRSVSLVHFNASIYPFCFHKRKRGRRTPADDTWEAWLTCCHGHYSLLVCRLKVNSHSGIILILLLFSGGRGNSEVSKEVNQPSQSGNSTESWESCFVFIEDATWCNSNRKSWEMGKRIMPSAQERLQQLQCCRLRDQGVDRP